MQIDAIYNQGKLELPEFIHLKHNRFPVQVMLPDEMIESKQVSRPHIQALLEDLNAILKAPLPAAADMPDLTEKQRVKITAFDLRSQYRNKQGRTA